MVVKVYISGISGNKEVKKRQQRVLMILDSKNISYDVIDITEPGNEADKDFMQNNSKSNGGTVSDPNPRSPLPPQVFNDDEYCGDYELFDMANEVDTLEQFLKMEVPPEEPPLTETEGNVNGEVNGRKSEDRESSIEKVQESAEDEVKEEESPDKQVQSKEGTPVLEDTGVQSKEPSPERAKSVENEPPVEKEQSQEKETEVKETSPDKESSSANGTASSRDQSEEKEVKTVVTESKTDLSEALIESEKVAASE